LIYSAEGVEFVCGAISAYARRFSCFYWSFSCSEASFWKIAPIVLSPVVSERLSDRLVEEGGPVTPWNRAPELEPELEMITVHLVGSGSGPGDLSPAGRFEGLRAPRSRRWSPPKRPILIQLIWLVPFTTVSRS